MPSDSETRIRTLERKVASLESRLRSMIAGTPSSAVASRHKGVTMFIKNKKANEIAEISLDTTGATPAVLVEKVK